MKNEGYILTDFEHEKIAHLFFAVHVAVADKNWDILNLASCREKINEGLKAIEIRMRFDRLHEESGGHLKYSIDGFTLDGHKFETLDEVEKALKNKAFL